MSPTNMAVLGYGYWGANLVRNVATAEGSHLQGIIESDAGRRAAAAAAYPLATIWASLDEALADDQVEAVVIAAPAQAHAQLALETLTAGKHVLVEKPLAMT